MRIGFIGDAHGDVARFRAGIELLRAKNVAEIYNAGDIVPARKEPIRGWFVDDVDLSALYTATNRLQGVHGNHDQEFLQSETRRLGGPAMRTYIKTLEEEIQIGEGILLTHAPLSGEKTIVPWWNLELQFELLENRCMRGSVFGHTHVRQLLYKENDVIKSKYPRIGETYELREPFLVSLGPCGRYLSPQYIAASTVTVLDIQPERVDVTFHKIPS
ncbi:MAG: metallophosphoesterase family protein [Candidatus Woesearchaeota archaeon]|nr:metallophosphoesterase family protein [Candidatus Woesearchaeota archaeon]